jgi:hypothetical protein
MTGVGLLERLGGRLPWVREHQRIRVATRSALAAADTDRQRVALLITALRLEIRRRCEGESGHLAAAGDQLPFDPQDAGPNEGGERC